MMTKKHRHETVWLLTLIFAYMAILAAITILNGLGADRLWFGALNLYLPQVVWAIPGILLSAFALKVAWQWTWIPLLGIAWVLGPIMGFCWPLNTPQQSRAGMPLRVMTWNVKYNHHDKLAHSALMRDIERNNPTVVVLQEAQGMLNGPFGDYFSKWNVRSYGQYIIASRLPLGELRILRISFPGEETTCPGTKHTCVRTQLQIGDTSVALYNVHFESPRWGLDALRVVRRDPWYLPKAIQQLENNVVARLTQVRTLQKYVRQEKGPVIIAGDLNSPDTSLVCATLRAVDLHDAFAEGGKGYGYTYGHFLLKHRIPALNISWMRIDHIMISSQFQSRHCWTGTSKASDHRPVIADLALGHN
jgi:vancomycin resistance protein VanJ